VERFYSLKIFFLSDTLYPKASRIFLLVSTLQGNPCSIRVIVRGDILAFTASSVLLSMRDFLICCKEFLLKVRHPVDFRIEIMNHIMSLSLDYVKQNYIKLSVVSG